MTNQIMKLVIKDFAIQKKSLINYLVICLLMLVFFSVMNISSREMLYSMIAFVIIYGLTNKALYEDEKNNTLRLLVSLPVKRKVIVYSRYLSVLIMIIGTVLLFGGLNLLFPDRTDAMNPAEAKAAGIISFSTILLFIIMLSFYLPMAFKLGYIKATNINRFLFILVFALFGGMGAAVGSMAKEGPPPFFTNIGNFFSALDVNLLFILAILFVAAVYLASMSLAVRFFEKRNLF